MHRFCHYPLIFLLISCFSGIAQQQQLIPLKEAELIRQKVEEAAKHTLTIQSEFIQTKEMSVLAEKIVSQGKFYFKKEKKLRWEYTSPFPYRIILNNDRMLVKDDNAENAVNIQSNKVYREINGVILGAIQGTLLSDRKKFQAAFSDARTCYAVKLTPQSPKLKESISEIVLYFNKTDYTVDRLVMREVSGDYTRIEFKEKKINQPIADENFFIP